MKAVHMPVTGHDLLAVERFRDDTSRMVEFLVLVDCLLGEKDQYIRRFLNEEGYNQVVEAQRQGHIQVYKDGGGSEGHIMPVKKKKRRGCK